MTGDPRRTDKHRKRGCGYFTRLAAFGVASFILLFFPIWEGMYIDAITRPVRVAYGSRSPADFDLAYEEVTIPTEEGFDLSGWYLPPRNGAVVVFLHGYGAVRLEMLDRAASVAFAGFGALLYDLRGHGKSGGEMRAYGWPDTEDLKAALDFLAARPEVDPQRIGVFGFSVGGQIVIRTAAADERIRCVIADDPAFAGTEDLPEFSSLEGWFSSKIVVPLDLRLVSARTGIPIPEGVAKSIGRIAPRPLFLILSARDEETVLLGRHFFSLAGEPKTLWEIPETGHGGTFAARPVEYAERMVAFYEESLLRE